LLSVKKQANIGSGFTHRNSIGTKIDSLDELGKEIINFKASDLSFRFFSFEFKIIRQK